MMKRTMRHRPFAASTSTCGGKNKARVTKYFAVASTKASTASARRRKRVFVGAKAAPNKSAHSKRLPVCKSTSAETRQPKKPCKAPSSASAKNRSGSITTTTAQTCDVYVLELQGGYVYVGKTTRGVQARLREHMTGKGSCPAAAFTKLHRPTGKLLPRLGNLQGEGDGPERDETLRQMFLRGPHMVRGWKYVRAGMLRKPELEDIECNIRELFDLCRTCGKAGHFATGCRERKDRNGKALRATVCA
jgi:hypothetical protein